MLFRSLIVIPVVVRPTDDMLKLVPNSLREAAYALGCPAWRMIVSVTYRAVRAGYRYFRRLSTMCGFLGCRKERSRMG